MVFRGLSPSKLSSYNLSSVEIASILSLMLEKSSFMVDSMFCRPSMTSFSTLYMYFVIESIVLAFISVIFFVRRDFLFCFL